MARNSERPPDLVLTPEQAQRVRVGVGEVVSSLSRRLEFQHFQLTGDQEAAALARAREDTAHRDSSRFLVDEVKQPAVVPDGPGGAVPPEAGVPPGAAPAEPTPAGSQSAVPSGVLGRDTAPVRPADQATQLNSVGGFQPATAVELRQGAIVPGQQPGGQPFGLPGGPTVGVLGVTAGLGGATGLGGMGMGMGMGMGGHGMHGGHGTGSSGPPKVLGRADPEVWGVGPQEASVSEQRGGTTLAGGELEPRRRTKGGRTGAGDAGGGGPPRGVLGRR
ncbi:hypothetical protein AB0C77_13830 [Streptomyces sp. NPDC048629]|uniref:hypothetical protein n=1 Tax=Streptomyces sp. NPDC048629 TaxID=3154824 RepID=UPI003427B38E